jgi:hypothetical protein
MTVGLSRRPNPTFSPSVGPAVVGSCNAPFMALSDVFACSVPVIAVFTKFDALERKAYQALLDENSTWEEAKAQALQRAVVDFEPQLNGLYQRPYPPQGHVYLRGKVSAL